MPITARGYPTPVDAPGVPNDVPGDLLALATAIDGDVSGLSAASQLKITTAQGVINTAESTTSTGFTNLATVGPDASVTPGPSGVVLVIAAADIDVTSGGTGIIGINQFLAADFNITGRVASAATETGLLIYRYVLQAGVAQNFRQVYATTAGTATFRRRRIIAISLP